MSPSNSRKGGNPFTYKTESLRSAGGSAALVDVDGPIAGSDPAGVVTATFLAHGELVSVCIASDFARRLGRESLGDAVMAAQHASSETRSQALVSRLERGEALASPHSAGDSAECSLTDALKDGAYTIPEDPAQLEASLIDVLVEAMRDFDEVVSYRGDGLDGSATVAGVTAWIGMDGGLRSLEIDESWVAATRAHVIEDAILRACTQAKKQQVETLAAECPAFGRLKSWSTADAGDQIHRLGFTRG